MKVLVLGGCADMAVPLLRLVETDADVREVLVADIDEAKAHRLAGEHGGAFRAAACDARQPESIVELMRGHDVTLSYVGPFYVFEKTMAACAIACSLWARKVGSMSRTPDKASPRPATLPWPKIAQTPPNSGTVSPSSEVRCAAIARTSACAAVSRIVADVIAVPP